MFCTICKGKQTRRARQGHKEAPLHRQAKPKFLNIQIIQMDKKGKHALLCESTLHKSLACKN